MITEWVVNIGIAIAEWWVSLIPDWDVPAELISLDDTVNGFFDQWSGLGVWAPWALLGICAGIAIGTWVLGVTVKAIRAIASYIPFFGGAG